MSPKAKRSTPSAAERRAPGLSETLTFPRRLDTCQSCGVIANEFTAEHERWAECDAFDKPTTVVVVLCDECSKRLIEPHARLYIHLHPFQPIPGAMNLCVGCAHQKDLRCGCPLAKHNGGPGMTVQAHSKGSVHLNMGGGRGEWLQMWDSPPSACAGREDAA